MVPGRCSVRPCGSTSTSSTGCSRRVSRVRPHRHRHAQRLRSPDAVRPGRRLPRAHHQEAAPALDHPASCSGSCAATPTCDGSRSGDLDLGRVGRRGGEPRAGLRVPVALVADTERRAHRPDRPSRGVDPHEPGLAAAHRLGLERRRRRLDGAAAVPRAVPVLRRPPKRSATRPALVPALPAVGRRLPRRAVQHRLVRAADDDGGAGMSTWLRASSSTRSGTRTSTSTTSTRPGCS